MRSAPILRILLGLALLSTYTAPAEGQILRRLRQAATDEIEKQAEARLRNAIRCAVGDEACIRRAQEEGKEVVFTDAKGELLLDEEGAPVMDADAAAAMVAGAEDAVWRNYDFVPGSEVWRDTDFSDEPVGRFPASQLEFVTGNMQIVELGGRKVLEAVGNSVVRLPLPSTLPESFTVEFTARIPTENIGIRMHTAPVERGPTTDDFVAVKGTTGIYRRGRTLSEMDVQRIVDADAAVKLQVDGEYAILYVDADRVAQVPVAAFGRGQALEFHLEGNSRFPTYLSDVVVAVGLDRLYDALMASGSVTTRGILFDSGSDGLRPESTPVLEELRDMLADHPELAVVIEGHTDAQGEDATNQDLSERRAAAVVRYLVDEGIEAARLSSSGRGESEPVADNATPEGRQQNRRVVIRRAEPAGL